MHFKQKNGGGPKGEILIHTLKVIQMPKENEPDSGIVEMTGWNIGAVVGDTVEAALVTYKIKEIKRRDHNGCFEKREEAINSFFEAVCTCDNAPSVENQTSQESQPQQ